MTTTAKTTAPKGIIKRNGKYMPNPFICTLAKQCLAQLGEGWKMECDIEQWQTEDGEQCGHIVYDFVLEDGLIVTLSDFVAVHWFKVMSGAYGCYLHKQFGTDLLAFHIQISTY